MPLSGAIAADRTTGDLARDAGLCNERQARFLEFPSARFRVRSTRRVAQLEPKANFVTRSVLTGGTTALHHRRLARLTMTFHPVIVLAITRGENYPGVDVRIRRFLLRLRREKDGASSTSRPRALCLFARYNKLLHRRPPLKRHVSDTAAHQTAFNQIHIQTSDVSRSRPLNASHIEEQSSSADGNER